MRNRSGPSSTRQRLPLDRPPSSRRNVPPRGEPEDGRTAYQRETEHNTHRAFADQHNKGTSTLTRVDVITALNDFDPSLVRKCFQSLVLKMEMPYKSANSELQ